MADLREGFAEGARDPECAEIPEPAAAWVPCQGRQCGPLVSGLLADWRGESMEAVGYYRLRSPQRLLSLAEFSRFQTLVSPARKEAAE